MSPDLNFEDFAVGQSYELGAFVLTEPNIVGFARAFDPQPFHLDRVAAEATPLKGLAASGWQTCAAGMRLFHDRLLARVASMGSPGVSELRWSAPVRPDAPVLGRLEIESARESKSRPEAGLVGFRYEMTQSGVAVCEQRFAVMIARRAPGPAAASSARPAKAPAPPFDLDALTPPEEGLLPTRLERIEIGRAVDLGGETVTPEAIIDFARRYDPQPFHLDEAAGRASVFGGLAASGWHTTALWMRWRMKAALRARAALHEELLEDFDACYGPSPGFDDLQWRRPVLAGDALRFYTRPLEARPMRSRPGWGLLFSENGAINQRGEVALRFIGKVMMRTDETG